MATVPWTTERFVAELDDDGDAVAWRDPSGSVDLIDLDIDESWIGTSVARFEEETGCHIVFLNRVGRAILPEARTALQDEGHRLRRGALHRPRGRSRRCRRTPTGTRLSTGGPTP